MNKYKENVDIFHMTFTVMFVYWHILTRKYYNIK